MKKSSFEKLDDWFVNLYKKWIFVRCFEFSAILISQLTWYRLYANIDRKTWFVFLETGFPKNKIDEIQNNLENKWYKIRVVEKDWNITETIWVNKLDKGSEKLINLKTNLIKF